MKKILSAKDESEIEENVLIQLISKKCTLSDFDQLVDKIHQYYRDNATLADLKVIANDIDKAHR
ncbi:hypothetical protein [Pediococcus acidilactici]|uniref:hypothetical protein n=1 Tax=Pediococcus acidilactici TaxID=1254 RepID=UPI00232E5B9A|nr:hypothetical protein [Pediococcus acidilactici]MDB8860137.1 hypothetical protein [Pediococcus acidilactici]MDB8861134.1 hypothetical protein [Pediococcus acidilactici]MDB8863825.1 hypothetical protein [Pediococcus acidilactici]MDB8866025.1 hypothetical protein [Pediococcus acidilactici]